MKSQVDAPPRTYTCRMCDRSDTYRWTVKRVAPVTQAIEAGWRRTRHAWMCADCIRKEKY